MKNEILKIENVEIDQEDIEKLTELFELLLEIDARQNKKISTQDKGAQKDI
jgi:hypothetical protein